MLRTYTNRALNSADSAIVAEPRSGMAMLANASFEPTVAPPGYVAPKISHATETRTPWPRSATDPASAIRPPRAIMRKEAIANPHSFFRRGTLLKVLFGLIGIIALPSSQDDTHHGVSPAGRVNLALTSNLLSKGAAANTLSRSGASLEAQSVIERWFILPQPPGPITALSTILPIRILRIFPHQ